MEQPLISVIIPVYNVARYLKRCVNSVLAQTYTNLEIILIDDGSTDQSPVICDDFALKNNRIKVIHQKNKGLSGARNTGLNIAQGSLIGFVDSDDWIDKDMYRELLNQLIKSDAEIASCGHWRIDEATNLNTLGISQSFKMKLNHEESLSYLIGFKDQRITNYAWDKLYDQKLFQTIRFPEGKMFEDVAVMYQIFDQATSVISIGKPLYNYYQRARSLTSSAFSERKLVLIQNTKGIIDFSQRYHGQFDFEAYASYASANLFIIQNIYLDKSKAYDYLFSNLVNNLREIRTHLKRNPYITTYDKVFMHLCMLIPVRRVMMLRYILKKCTNLFKMQKSSLIRKIKFIRKNSIGTSI